MLKYLDFKNDWSQFFCLERWRTLKFLPAQRSIGRPRLLVTCCFLLALLCSPLVVFLSYYQDILRPDIIRNTKTLAGDNLEPPPWQRFHHRPFTIEERQSRTPKIMRCTRLSCGLSLQSLFKPRKPRFNSDNPKSCPSYFQWIYEDLVYWRETGITKETLEKAKEKASFRVVIVGGRLYTEFYYHCFQTRTMFSLWGLVMLLERYPGMIPDVDLMFDCADPPTVRKEDYKVDNNWPPPPLFRYCTSNNHYDIPFPDWSYWGWPEVNIMPWDLEMDNIFNGSKKIPWRERLPFAYWKGNIRTGRIRKKLQGCNSIEKYNAEILHQDWRREVATGFKNSKLADQCGHRYKIYAEGISWSVSLKYAMACGSTVLLIDPQYIDFFMRGLQPLAEYWPINYWKLCPSIQYAVGWGNVNLETVEEIGQRAHDFLREHLGMHDVYDYMLHLLKEYSYLLRFKPSIPNGALEICRDSIICLAEPLERQFLQKSNYSNNNNVDILSPCLMPPHDHEAIIKLLDDKKNQSMEVQRWEHEVPL